MFNFLISIATLPKCNLTSELFWYNIYPDINIMHFTPGCHVLLPRFSQFMLNSFCFRSSIKSFDLIIHEFYLARLNASGLMICNLWVICELLPSPESLTVMVTSWTLFFIFVFSMINRSPGIRGNSSSLQLGALRSNNSNNFASSKSREIIKIHVQRCSRHSGMRNIRKKKRSPFFKITEMPTEWR